MAKLEFPLSMVLEIQADLGILKRQLTEAKSVAYRRGALGEVLDGQHELDRATKINMLETQIIECKSKRNHLLDLAVRRGQITEGEAEIIRKKP